MRKFNNQSGRSMIEMLGVLAIVGVLSVGGIAGYSKAMEKFRLSKANEQISMIVANTRITFGSVGDFAGLDNISACKIGLYPSEMVVNPSGATCTAATKFKNAFGGGAMIKASNSDELFGLSFDMVPKDACIFILSSDWGNKSTSGFHGIRYAMDSNDDTAVANVDLNAPSESESGALATKDLPLSIMAAEMACTNPANISIITWYFR